MMRSLFSGVSGLRVHQTKMDVIGNNIANVNTVGYKSSRVTFNEVFSQTLGGASAPNPMTNHGGINPMQVGLGASVASIDKLMTTGASQRTDNPFDLMIQGDGFFIVGDSSGTYFTRAGALNVDPEGNIVTTSGLKIMGWDTDEAGTSIKEGVVTPMQITGTKEYIKPVKTTQVNFGGNLNASANEADAKVSSMTFFDSVGNSYVLDTEMQYVKANGTDDAHWDFRVVPIAYPNGDRSKGVKVDINVDDPDAPVITFSSDLATEADKELDVSLATLKFSTGGLPPAGADERLITAPTDTNSPNGNQLRIQFIAGDPDNSLLPPAEFGQTIGDVDNIITIDFSNLTQFGNETSNATATAKDGNGPGNLNGLTIGSDGMITGRYSNGQTKILGQIPVARFANPAGLEKVGGNLFVTTPNSGGFDGIGEAVQNGGGSMLGGVLEMSNVDLSSEFTEMITTQRGFQASSRIITTSDDMLQELVNLKR